MEIIFNREHTYRIDLDAKRIKDLHAKILEIEEIDAKEYPIGQFRRDVKDGCMPYMDGLGIWVDDNAGSLAQESEHGDAIEIEIHP